ncbi:MAG: hypothetical protein LUG83_03785 [Lachnospiraceae bacterium]|nr:hypothetical protein [Lachnospiraceae bacterium]
MACFIVPAVEAVATTVAAKVLESKAKESNVGDIQTESRVYSVAKKVRVLSNLLWGGSALLAFEHVWHGEVVPWFPFLTAAGSPADMTEMLHEMGTVGVSMALLVTVVWGIGCLVARRIEKHYDATTEHVER